jgi:hypothetical protein
MKHDIMAFWFFTLSSSVHVKIGLKSRPIVSNRLYRFENTNTWHEVFVEVCDDDFFLRKTEEICVTVSDRSGHSFEPDLEEPIQVVQEFDSALQFASSFLHLNFVFK